MKLKSLFNRMVDNFEISSNKDRISNYSLSVKSKKKTKIRLREYIEFTRYLDELREKRKNKLFSSKRGKFYI